MMTKKHYKRIAEILLSARIANLNREFSNNTGIGERVIRSIENDLIVMFTQDNSRFSKSRFEDATWDATITRKEDS